MITSMWNAVTTAKIAYVGKSCRHLAQRDKQSHKRQHEPENRRQPIEPVGGLRVRLVEQKKIAQPVQAELGITARVLAYELRWPCGQAQWHRSVSESPASS